MIRSQLKDLIQEIKHAETGKIVASTMSSYGPDLYFAEKKIASSIRWVTERDWATFEVSLEIAGVAVEGLRMRGKAFVRQPNREVMLQIEYVPSRLKLGPLDRIDWNPFHTHDNKGKGPDNLRFQKIIGSHHHRFDLNWLDEERRMRTGNLPIAVPLPQTVATAGDLFRFAEECFRIANLRDHRLPDWQGDLFGSMP